MQYVRLLSMPRVTATGLISLQGIGERGDLYEKTPEGQDWPKQPSTLTVDVNLHGVIWTAYLALAAFRKNESKSGKLVMTASSAALYPSGPLPIYAATKHAVSVSNAF